MHGLKYQILPILAIAFLLLVIGSPSHAALDGAFPFSEARLSFTIEQHPGKGDWIGGMLDGEGEFRIHTIDQGTLSGTLPARESRRILEAYGKLCEVAGESLLPPGRVFVGFKLGGEKSASFSYVSSQGRHLDRMGADHPVRPEFSDFLRILWQKLLNHHYRQKLLDSLIPPLPR